MDFLVVIFRISLIFLNLYQFTSSTDDEFKKSLYSDDDPILQLSLNDFNQSVYMKNKAYFIEFYSSWCGHCIHFAPIYKQFAYNVSSV